MIDTRMSKMTAARRAGWLVGASALAFGLAAPALAQTAPEQETPPDAAQPQDPDAALPQDDAADAIVVTGLRASLPSAQAINRNSGHFVDSVPAIYTGKRWEERRVAQECVSTGRTRWAPTPNKNRKNL